MTVVRPIGNLRVPTSTPRGKMSGCPIGFRHSTWGGSSHDRCIFIVLRRLLLRPHLAVDGAGALRLLTNREARPLRRSPPGLERQALRPRPGSRAVRARKAVQGRHQGRRARPPGLFGAPLRPGARAPSRFLPRKTGTAGRHLWAYLWARTCTAPALRALLAVRIDVTVCPRCKGPLSPRRARHHAGGHPTGHGPRRPRAHATTAAALSRARPALARAVGICPRSMPETAPLGKLVERGDGRGAPGFS